MINIRRTGITPDNTVFVLLSFEGPDPYAMAGGLGVRMVNLSKTLTHMGFPTDFFFIGDPKLKGEDRINGSRLILHRWCQWISEYYPNGVYQGENEKLNDFNESIPGFVTEHILKPAVEQDKLVVILGEEWHTAETVCRLNDLLLSNDLRDRVVMFWNANNTYGFDRVDWQRLNQAATITTVSRYMKHIMRDMALNPLVIPNGIPSDLLRKVDSNRVNQVKNVLGADLILFKMARYHPDKGWGSAIEATGRLRGMGLKTVLLARGGIESYGCEAMQDAKSLGLSVKEAKTKSARWDDHLYSLSQASPADIIDIKFHLPPESSRVLYQAADGVLANSNHEPFGLVGLEAMAAGGVAYTGGTGEDYAIPFINSIVLETEDPLEITGYVTYLMDAPQEDMRIRRTAKRTARQFTWDVAVENLIGKLTNQARIQGNLVKHAETPQLSLFSVENVEESLEKLPELGVLTYKDECPVIKQKTTGEAIEYGQNTEAEYKEVLCT